MRADKERRRAISREAARRRRRVESDIFGDLCRLLPLQASIRDHLDKPSVIRLALCYIRLKTLLQNNLYLSQFLDLNGTTKAAEETDIYLTIMEGFVMVLSLEGDMMFLSDNVSCYLGLTATELMGHNIFEFTHPYDHKEIKSNLHLTEEEFWSDAKRDFVVRIKSTLSLRGQNTNIKSATWKVLQCQGRARTCAGPFLASCLLLTCRPLPVSHTLLCARTFSSQHSMDMRFTQCDHSVLKEPVSQQPLQDASEGRRVCVGGKPQRRGTEGPDVQVQKRSPTASYGPLRHLRAKRRGGAVPAALRGPMIAAAEEPIQPLVFLGLQSLQFSYMTFGRACLSDT
ncbi:endothelial PAS domain-containing protein 1 isoform X2 [Syngnathus scovelli]|uniref:endothelial PAS domain-containing protein 1 isoform X2 n=1 Tax=Syngnathus scovelli TaxID=161590 RepID=UPI0021102489|nr:endothelial PAS domain-containing protein 1 isoform X2 [Syngnathus scovelli]